MVFNIYISELPETTSRRYGYADDLAILLRRPSWKEVEEGLNKGMTILVDYLRKWRIQLSIGKTVSAAYHLNNKDAKRELDGFVDNKRLVCQQAPKYLGVHLDRMLNFKQHLEEVARVALIRHPAGTTWGASAKTLRISTQALVFPAAEYCAPVWSRSPHVKNVDVAINSSLRTISGCLKPTPVLQFPVLAGIAPAGLRRKAAIIALARKAVKHDWHILHDKTNNEVPPYRLKSRTYYNKEAQEMLSGIPGDRSKDAWLAATWKQEWEASGPTRIVHRQVSDTGEGVNGDELSRKHWTTLNWLRTGVGRYRAELPRRSGDWRAVQHVSVASQNRQLTRGTSSTAAQYIDHHPKLASSKLGHWPEHGSNTLSWIYETNLYERRRRIIISCYCRLSNQMGSPSSHVLRLFPPVKRLCIEVAAKKASAC